MNIHVGAGSETRAPRWAVLCCALISLTEAQIKTILLLRDSLEAVKSDFRQTMAERGDAWASISDLRVIEATNPDYFGSDCGLIEDNTTEEPIDKFWHLQAGETACALLIEDDVIELTDKDLEIKRARMKVSWEAADRIPDDFEDIAASVNSDAMVISADGVSWEAYEDYSGSQVETVWIPYDLLEKRE